ncbi:VENN motif pre-toxin domain-containing protein [Pseudomonas cichorii]|uniref:VENN motif pre-toxin domain-containing protein n=1 Tax=Pseudomonas cichorii TaxID=36746 RepID=UPI0019109FC9|nr:VENN motif pre-toxin domain-containing protein [Pseudomonas cichorii]
MEYLAEKLLPTNVDPNSDAYKIGVSKLLTTSELVGALTAAAAGGDASVGADVAANGTEYNYLEHSENEAFIKDMLGCDTDKCAKEKWELGGFDQDSQGNIEYANDVAGSMRARDARDRVMDKLDSILDMNCPTSACEGYKQLLVQRSLDTLEHLNGVIKDWATLDNYLGLMHGAAVAAQRGAILAASPAESLALIRAQKALDYLRGAKAEGGAVELKS